MKPWLKIILTTFLGVLLLMAIVSVSISVWYGKQLKNMLLHYLNQHLLTKIEIRGSMDIQLWRNFPYASLVAEEVVIHGSEPHAEKTLASVNKLYFLISLYDLIRQQWNIASIHIEKGTITLYKSGQGDSNFRLTKETVADTTADGIVFRVNHARLKEVVIEYIDESSDVRMDFTVSQATLRGNLNKEQLSVDAELHSHINELTLKHQTYLPGKKIVIKGSIQIDTDHHHYRFQAKQMLIEGTALRAGGFIALPKKGLHLGMHIYAPHAKLTDVIQLLPEHYTQSIRSWQLKGNINAEVHINGTLDESSNPAVKAQVQLTGGSFPIKSIQAEARDLSASIIFHNGPEQNNRTSVISFDNIRAVIAGKEVRGNINIKNFDNPIVHANYNGQLDLALFQPFLIKDTSISLKGLIQVKELQLTADINSLRKLSHPDKLDIRAILEAHDIKTTTKQQTILLHRSDIVINNQLLSLKQGQLSMLGADMQLELNLHNWKQYLFALTHPEYSANNRLHIDADLSANYFNWKAWYDFFSLQHDSSPDSENKRPNINRLQAANLDGTARVSIAHAVYNKFNARQLSAQLNFTPNQIFLHNGSFLAAAGTCDVKGYFAFKDHRLETNFSLVAQNTALKEIFEGFDNFGQSYLTHQHIDGKITASIQVSSVWHNGIFDKDAFYTYADLKIENGKLTDFKALESLARFIEIEELRNIRFGTLKNIIEIKHQTITFPKMLITSSALSLSASGTHTFNGHIDYYIRLNLFDILGRKFSKRKHLFEFEEVDEDDFNLFLHITGTADKPIVKYDRSGLKEKLQQQKEAFRHYKEGNQKPYTRAKESQQWDTSQEPEYIEWD